MSAFEPAPLLELFDDDRSEVASLLATAGRSVADDVARIAASLAERDAREIGARAHRIKGTSSAIGARAVCAAATSLEAEARSGAWPALPSLVDALRAQAEALTNDIAHFCTAGAGTRSIP